ncbi:hypothetical protein VNO77_15953 [Canavalia gladiata]|uniref:AB hydrolase-1 domain-containing protein n=1 Tax=Canavalia gladiata TaxID=3824 RepID=A0AAN9QPH6_CANGL
MEQKRVKMKKMKARNLPLPRKVKEEEAPKKLVELSLPWKEHDLTTITKDGEPERKQGKHDAQHVNPDGQEHEPSRESQSLFLLSHKSFKSGPLSGVGGSFFFTMATGVNRKISAASARAHTRRPKKTNSSQLPSGMLRTTLAVVFIGFLAWAYKVVQPPPPKICGSPDGPPITAARIKLRDGRHLAFKEHGVPKDAATYKIIYVHPFDSCRHDAVIAHNVSPDIVEKLGVYSVSFDRPGYGESDPDPNWTLKSIALDIEELADQLGLGPKFYIVGYSIGGQVVWNCLKYIPHRLAGAVLIAPAINFWWPGLPANLTTEAYNLQKLPDQWAFRVAHYLPWLTYWWNTQRWFPSSNVVARSPDVLSDSDKELVLKFTDRKTYEAQVRQQGEHESVYRDLIIAFGSWEYSPLDLENPFPNNEGSVHLWQGDEDLLVPATLQRFIVQKLPWIHYHELKGSGHLLAHADGVGDTIIKSLLHVK